MRRAIGLFIGHAEQVLIWNDDQRVDIALQFLNPGLGRVHPVAALEMKRLGHHPDGKDTAFAASLGDHRRGAGAGAAAHAAVGAAVGCRGATDR